MKQRPSDEHAPAGTPTDAPDAPRVSRRLLLQFAGIGLAAPLLTDCKGDEEETPVEVLVPGDAFFKQSVASGDPRPESVVLWTRVEDGSADIPLTLTIARDAAFADVVATQALLATAAHDHVIKLRVSGLAAGSYYYFRFVYDKAGTKYVSRTGRTKTAPAAGSDVPVKFAFVSCQDFIGRFFNAYAKMLEVVDELDFVVHLGDYIYETTGDPNFQSTPGARGVAFTDTAGAIAFTDANGDVTHYAAQSLSNYRELYQAYRTDPYLQRVHESVPFIAIWDDHEFTDDCWRDTATYYDGKVDETARTERRRAAEQAYFEHMPCEFGIDADGALAVDADHVPIADAATVIHRDFEFGQHLHLVMSDTRTYRPDHLVAEDAFYGTVVVDQAALAAAGEDPAAAGWAPYLDIDAGVFAAYKFAALAALEADYLAAVPTMTAAEAQARAAAALTGNVTISAINDLTTGMTPIDPAGAPRGMSIDELRFQKGKLFSNDGINARYLVNKRTFDIFARARFAASAQSQDLFGASQQTWLDNTLSQATATWKVLGTSISLAAMIIDMRPASFPPSLEGLPDSADIHAGAGLFQAFFPEPYLFSVDQWDGFPDKRAELLDTLRGIENAVVISGDIHSAYVSDYGKGATGAYNVHEFTGVQVSSESFKGFTRGKVDAVVPGASQNTGVAALILHLEEFLKQANPSMVYASNDTVGFSTIEVDATQLTSVYYFAPEDFAHEDHNTDRVAAAAPFQTRTWVIQANQLSEV
ncbi:MAG: alkaline phosphatase D family protein [Myxococcales bacterium]|nr:alkaline phosphatase D family protein [Myxococcales bacterium]